MKIKNKLIIISSLYIALLKNISFSGIERFRYFELTKKNTTCLFIIKKDIYNLINELKNNEGCMIIKDRNKYIKYGKDICDLEVSPCSTFKIVLTLAGLKYGVLQDENTLFKWDGKKRFFDFWNKDLTLKEAFECSAVWYFEKVANEIGIDKLSRFVKEISYGNCDTSGKFPFWNDSSLKISPKQQIEFIENLFENKIQIDKSHLNIIKNIMKKGNINGGTLYGKTGTSGEGNNGWFVGVYEKNNKYLYFATRLSARSDVSGSKAEEITKYYFENFVEYFGDIFPNHKCSVGKAYIYTFRRINRLLRHHLDIFWQYL